MKILIVDDEPDVLFVIRAALQGAGFEVIPAGSAAEALAQITKHGLPHLAVLDIMMPEVDGLDLARQLLEFCDLPIVMLTAVDQKTTLVQTIEEIAEDYILKPFDPDELVARVRRVLRRIGDFSYTLGPTVVIDDILSLDFVGLAAIVEGRRLPLTPTETKILHILVRRAGRSVGTGFLLNRVWPLAEVFEDTLRVHIHRLRHKIEPDPGKPRYLVTQRGVGYCFLAKE